MTFRPFEWLTGGLKFLSVFLSVYQLLQACNRLEAAVLDKAVKGDQQARKQIEIEPNIVNGYKIEGAYGFAIRNDDGTLNKAENSKYLNAQRIIQAEASGIRTEGKNLGQIAEELEIAIVASKGHPISNYGGSLQKAQFAARNELNEALGVKAPSIFGVKSEFLRDAKYHFGEWVTSTFAKAVSIRVLSQDFKLDSLKSYAELFRASYKVADYECRLNYGFGILNEDGKTVNAENNGRYLHNQRREQAASMGIVLQGKTDADIEREMKYVSVAAKGHSVDKYDGSLFKAERAAANEMYDLLNIPGFNQLGIFAPFVRDAVYSFSVSTANTVIKGMQLGIIKPDLKLSLSSYGEVVAVGHQITDAESMAARSVGILTNGKLDDAKYGQYILHQKSIQAEVMGIDTSKVKYDEKVAGSKATSIDEAVKRVNLVARGYNLDPTNEKLNTWEKVEAAAKNAMFDAAGVPKVGDSNLFGTRIREALYYSMVNTANTLAKIIVLGQINELGVDENSKTIITTGNYGKLIIMGYRISNQKCIANYGYSMLNSDNKTINELAYSKYLLSQRIIAADAMGIDTSKIKGKDNSIGSRSAAIDEVMSIASLSIRGYTLKKYGTLEKAQKAATADEAKKLGLSVEQYRERSAEAVNRAEALMFDWLGFKLSDKLAPAGTLDNSRDTYRLWQDREVEHDGGGRFH